MALKLLDNVFHPDVLSCLADLSNDEVFTPPKVAKEMLDMLPQELFRSPDTKFLDPACKSGIFLREITERLNEGLKDIIPDPQERIDHILHNQVYGIAITQITALLSRRSVYCSKDASGKYSLSHFDNSDGNIRFKETKHYWENGNCKYCGASKAVQDRGDGKEAYAYEFIHRSIREIVNMKFDVVISNPPYQLSDGGSKASAKPIYHLFVQQAIKMTPKYLVMIIPSRWFSGGKGLDSFRNDMLKDNRIRHITDYFDSNECFPGVDISGGICYFLWTRDSKGLCEIESKRQKSISIMKRPLLEGNSESFIRFNEAVPIVRKVVNKTGGLFATTISSRKPFGLETNCTIHKKSMSSDDILIYAYPENGYISKYKVSMHREWIDKIKVCVSYAYGERGSFPYQIIGKPFIAPVKSCCTETYLVIRVCDNIREANNIISYMTTKFFRFLVLLKKNTQHATRNVYEFVPNQDFSKSWTDTELYKKYELTQKEIDFIESMIKPMELGGDSNG